jgi:hypothetical protein
MVDLAAQTRPALGKEKACNTMDPGGDQCLQQHFGRTEKAHDRLYVLWSPPLDRDSPE